MSKIIHEIPSGTINWVNWVFTTSVNLDNLIEVRYDWVKIDPSNYTYSAPTLTLDFWYEPHYNITVIWITWSWYALDNWQIYLANEWFNELPDWSRTTFTISSGENIEEIISVIADWVDVLPTDYSIDSNNSSQINLAWAPDHPSSPMFADVVVTASGGSDDNFAWNASQADLINRIYKIINEKTTSITYDKEETEKILCEIQRQVCVGSYVDINQNKYKAPKLSFLTRKRFYKTTEGVELSEDIDETTISFSVTWDVTDYKTSGYLRIEWDVVEYSNLDTDTKTFSWVTWINTTHKTNTRVNQLHSLPLDFMEAFLIKVFDSQYYYYEPIPLPYKEIRSNIFATEYFSLEQDREWNQYLMIRWFQKWYTIEFNYTKVPPCITSSINSIIPNPYAIRILPRLVAADLLTMWDWVNAGIVEMWRLQEQEWVKELISMYEEYATEVETYRKQVSMWRGFRKNNKQQKLNNSYYYR